MTIIKPTLVQNGFEIYKEALNLEAQNSLVETIRLLAKECPLYQPTMPKTNKPLNVRMTNLGEYGWVSDIKGYRYQKHHPVTRKAWAAIPPQIIDIWQCFTGNSLTEFNHNNPNAPLSQWKQPQCCLVNHYGVTNKMGMHVDMDENDHITPVLSISLGDDAIFRMGSQQRGGKTSSIKLQSGDIVVFANDVRLNYHGVDRIIGGTSSLLKHPGRLNLTLRRVD
ncbi:MAG: alpha-ketoglutarate-dependent dioxygenase AlkB [Rhizobiales bacterium]|nr:alpha-ketoglutarate-dependent dioxygenase AlkB [Hyphomicrobiales bacterium]